MISTHAAGAKVIAIVDSGQVPSVKAGGRTGEIGQRVGVHRLTQVIDQCDLAERHRRCPARAAHGRPAHAQRERRDLYVLPLGYRCRGIADLTCSTYTASAAA